MAQQYPRAGLGNVGSYQISGHPFVTGSTVLSSSFGTNNSQVVITFPTVTKSVTIISRSATNLRVHFNSMTDGNVISGSHYIILQDIKDSFTFDMRLKEIFVSLEDGAADGEFELFAELTTIGRQEMYPLTGSGLTD